MRLPGQLPPPVEKVGLAYWRRLSPVELRGFATWPTAWGVWDGVRASALSHENNRATHPVNAMLNYAYSIAACKLEIAAMAKGLDVTAGSLHETDKALVYDLVELDRARVTHAVLAYATGKRWKRSDFKVDVSGEVRLSPSTARKVASVAVPSRARVHDIVLMYCRWLGGD